MTDLIALPYQLRLLGLCLAVFFLVHAVAGLVVAALGSTAVRRAERMPPRAAVQLLLGLRLAPLALSLFAVLALCVPSYLSLEPDKSPEHVGAAFIAAALLGLALWATAAGRATHAVVSTLRYRRHCERNGRRAQMPGEAAPLLVLDWRERSPLLFLAGVFHPRMVASSTLLGALSAEQLDAAVRHERAHADAHDNLKRLLLVLAPGVAPGWSGFSAIERGWARLVEWAADDEAVDGDSRRSLSLAGALVRVARLGSLPRRQPLVAHLLVENQDLAARVNRLLAPPAASRQLERGLGFLLPGALGVAMAATLAIVMRPGALYSVHVALEKLIH